MKKLLEQPEGDSPKMIEAAPTAGCSSKTVVFQPGVLQELMIEVNMYSHTACMPSALSRLFLDHKLCSIFP